MKDALGHGSDTRGGEAPERDRLKHSRVGLAPGARFSGKVLGPYSPSSEGRAVVDAIRGGHPKSAPVPTHPAQISGRVDQMSFGQRRALSEQDIARERHEYNRDLSLRIRDRQVGSGMKHR